MVMRRIQKFIRTVLLFWWAILGLGIAHASDSITYIHNDPSGSPVMATDAQGRTVWKESYRPYGDRLRKEAASNTNTLWFSGKPADTNTGLSYFGARYYDPVLGRFVGVDPAAFDPDNLHSFNRYTYANNNPYRYVDPDGHSPIDVVFFVYDLGKLGTAIYTGTGVLAAGSDLLMSAVGVVSPVPGAGQALKAARAVDRAVDVGKVAKGLPRRADFEVGPSGTAIPTSKNRLQEGFERAEFESYPNKRTTEAGTIYRDPNNGNLYRVMEGSDAHPPRLMTHAPSGNPLRSDGSNIPPGLSRDQIRDLTHFKLEQ